MISSESSHYDPNEMHRPSTELSVPERMHYAEQWKKIIAELFMRHADMAEIMRVEDPAGKIQRRLIATDPDDTYITEALAYHLQRFESAPFQRSGVVMSRQLHYFLGNSIMTLHMQNEEYHRAASSNIERHEQWDATDIDPSYELYFDSQSQPVVDIIIDDGRQKNEVIELLADGDARDARSSGKQSMTLAQAQKVQAALERARDKKPIPSRVADGILQLLRFKRRHK